MSTRSRLLNVKKIKKHNSKRYFKPLVYPNIPLSIDDFYVTTTVGDRLDLLANQFYKDVRLWWIISAANRDIIRRDSYAVKPGIEIRIPGNINHILKAFELLNR
jgi:LysM repeat protein